MPAPTSTETSGLSRKSSRAARRTSPKPSIARSRPARSISASASATTSRTIDA